MDNHIEIKNGNLVFKFNQDARESHMRSELSISLNQTLRIPDDGNTHSLPPGLGHFSLKHVEDYQKQLPEEWVKRGGVFMPMHMTEAMWFGFSQSGRPCAIKIAAGMINAVTGKEWENDAGLTNQRGEQNYMVSDQQRWLDGFKTGEGKISQFVAMPLKSGYTVEEQLTGEAKFGGFQIEVYPMKMEIWEKIRPKGSMISRCLKKSSAMSTGGAASLESMSFAASSMGMAAGGSMEQSIEIDKYGPEAFDTNNKLRLFISVMEAAHFELVTGEKPQNRLLTENDYRMYGYHYHWFTDPHKTDVSTSEILKNVKTIADIAQEKGHHIPGAQSTFSSPMKKK